MSNATSRAHLVSALASHFPDGLAEDQFQRALAQSGLPDQPDYAPEELAVLGRVMLEMSRRALEPSLPDLEEIPGPAGI